MINKFMILPICLLCGDLATLNSSHGLSFRYLTLYIYKNSDILETLCMVFYRYLMFILYTVHSYIFQHVFLFLNDHMHF